MRFGSKIRSDGASFRIWAPAARQVDVSLEGQRVPMTRTDDGWFESTVTSARVGDLYQFVIDGGEAVPDPASRYQPRDANGPSQLIDPRSYAWTDDDWIGRPWYEAVIYELHLGTFTEEGTYAAAARHLGRLADLGLTAIELMPLADFAGARNWGYDGVLPFAPDSRYGRPEELKAFICAAHSLGLMVLIDVVYNHFGPEANFLPIYAPQFFARRNTPWGQALDFTSRHLREFFIDNALYWLEEYHMDGLRLDAVHAIDDDGSPHFLEELAATIRQRLPLSRHVHLVIENDKNEAHFLDRAKPGFYDAQWNDDFHHAMHVILTGETAGYYADYSDRPLDKLGRSLAGGFIYRGEWSDYRGAPRGEPSSHLPPTAFVNFLQNHDQIGNRALGERLTRLAAAPALAAAAAIQILSPGIPLLFMGEELGAADPFLFFCDFKVALADSVREGRRREFSRVLAFASQDARQRIPDPLAIETFERSGIARAAAAPDAATRDRYCRLLDIRRREIVPRLGGDGPIVANHESAGDILTVHWRFCDGSRLALSANLTAKAKPWRPPCGAWRRMWGPSDLGTTLPPWTAIFMTT